MNNTNINTTDSTVFFSSCLNAPQKDLIYINDIVGNVSNMKYMLSGKWRNEVSTYVLSIMMSIFVFLCGLSIICLYLVKKYRKGVTSTDKIMLFFNLSNVIIFIMLSLLGWSTNTFFMAAVHNSIEMFLCVTIFIKYYKFLQNHKRIYMAIKDFAFLLSFILCLPHLIIVNFEINTYLKMPGGATDIILFIICIIAYIKFIIYAIKHFSLKKNVPIIKHTHFWMVNNIFAHTLTVIFTFLSCEITIFHLICIIIGTFFMNLFGVIYCIVSLREKSNPPSHDNISSFLSFYRFCH